MIRARKRTGLQSGRIVLALALLTVWLLIGNGCSKRVLRTEPGRSAGDPRTIVHQVTPGETLSRIADNYYGDPDRYQRIATDNGITDPARLAPGSALLLRFSKQEWRVAQRRAAAMQPYNHGVESLEQERLDDAEQEFRLALEIAPEFHSARYNLALVLLKRGQHEQAEELLDGLVAERPRDQDVLFAYGHVLFLEARFAEAATIFRRLLGKDPQHRRGTFGLARALQEAGNHSEAIGVWEAYLGLDDTSAWADVARRNLQELRRE